MNEEAAFLYCRQANASDGLFECVGYDLMKATDFAIQLPYHFELDGKTLAGVIKKAHDTETILFEVHSHLGPGPAEFSLSDIHGFDELVPYVRWRLKGQPYGAIVVTRTCFDGFAWVDDLPEPVPIARLQVGAQVHHASKLSKPRIWRNIS